MSFREEYERLSAQAWRHAMDDACLRAPTNVIVLEPRKKATAALTTVAGEKDDVTVPLADIVAEDRLGLLRGKKLAEHIHHGEVNAWPFRLGEEGLVDGIATLDLKDPPCALCGVKILKRGWCLGWWSPIDGAFAMSHRWCYGVARETGAVPDDGLDPL